MATSFLELNDRTRSFFGGPGIGIVAALIAAAIAIPILVSLSDWSTFTTAASLFIGAVVAASIGTAFRNGAARAVWVAGAGFVSVLILFVVGATGIFSMSDDFQWSGLSAVTGIILGSVAMGAVLNRTRHRR